MPSPPGKRTHFPHHCAGSSLEGWLGRGRGRVPMSPWHPDVTQEGEHQPRNGASLLTSQVPG